MTCTGATMVGAKTVTGASVISDGAAGVETGTASSAFDWRQKQVIANAIIVAAKRNCRISSPGGGGGYDGRPTACRRQLTLNTRLGHNKRFCTEISLFDRRKLPKAGPTPVQFSQSKQASRQRSMHPLVEQLQL